MKKQNLEGMCPKCLEYTTANESCCGSGAFVDGSFMSEEEALKILNEEAETNEAEQGKIK